VGYGEMALFLSDKWETDTLDSTYPRLFSFAKNKLYSVKQALAIRDIGKAFHLALSAKAMIELQMLQ
jgi:hypothetical protein